MVMSRRTAKNLNGVGAVVLACLGLALLPVPVCAQPPTPDKVVPSQVQPAKKAPSLDEQIEVLRRVLQQLEEQKRKEQGQAAPSRPANPASPWPANWKEINKVIDEMNRLTRELEESQTLYRAAGIKLRRAHAELALLKAKSPADTKEINTVIDEINRLLREVDENRTLSNAANIMLRRAYAEVERLQGPGGSFARSRQARELPSNVVPVQVSPR